MFAMYNRLGLRVSASNIDVIRAARSKLKPRSRKLMNPSSKDARKGFYQAMLAEHEDARALFYRVQTGSV